MGNIYFIIFLPYFFKKKLKNAPISNVKVLPQCILTFLYILNYVGKVGLVFGYVYHS
jgi:hypothetical protein